MANQQSSPFGPLGIAGLSSLIGLGGNFLTALYNSPKQQIKRLQDAGFHKNAYFALNSPDTMQAPHVNFAGDYAQAAQAQLSGAQTGLTNEQALTEPYKRGNLASQMGLNYANIGKVGAEMSLMAEQEGLVAAERMLAGERQKTEQEKQSQLAAQAGLFESQEQWQSYRNKFWFEEGRMAEQYGVELANTEAETSNLYSMTELNKARIPEVYANIKNLKSLVRRNEAEEDLARYKSMLTDAQMEEVYTTIGNMMIDRENKEAQMYLEKMYSDMIENGNFVQRQQGKVGMWILRHLSLSGSRSITTQTK